MPFPAMARAILRALTLAVALGACSPAVPPKPVRTGTLVGGTGPLPGAIAGLRYEAGDLTGYTDAQGTFEYRDGEDVVFSLGPLQFAPTEGRPRLSPFQLANGSGCAVGDPLANVLRLLQSADADGDPDNGLALPELPPGDAPREVATLSAADLDAALQEVAPGAVLVDASTALDRFVRQVDDEAWRHVGDDTFSGWDALFRSQGAATDGTSWWFSSTLHLQRTDAAFTPVVDNAHPIPADAAALGGDHIGDIDVSGGLLYAPIEDGAHYLYPTIVAYDADTLKPTGASWLLPVDLLTQGVPWVAVDAARGFVYAAEWNPTLRIERFDLENDDLPNVDALELSEPLGRLQGAKVVGAELYASSDNDDKSIYAIDLDTGTVMKRFALDTPDSEVEGLAPIAEPDGLHLRILNVVVPNVVFADYRRIRNPLRDALCR
jgi:hypothetical protein